MTITIKHENDFLEMPNGTILTVNSLGIATLYNGEAQATIYFKHIAAADNVLIRCNNKTDYSVAEAFRKRIEKAGEEQ